MMLGQWPLPTLERSLKRRSFVQSQRGLLDLVLIGAAHGWKRDFITGLLIFAICARPATAGQPKPGGH